MEQQTITGSGLYILIAVQLLFSMLILLRIRQYRKKPTGCLPSVLVILSTAVFTSVLYYIWQIVCDRPRRNAYRRILAGVGGMGIFWTVRCAVHRCRLLPLRVCPHRSSPQVLQRNVAEPHRNDAHPIPHTRPAGCIHAVHQPFRDDTFHLAVFRSSVQRRGDAGTECRPIHLRIYRTSGLPVQVQRQ